MSYVNAIRGAVSRRIRARSEGQTLVEYGLLLTLIALVVMVVLLLLGPIISLFYSNTAQQIS